MVGVDARKRTSGWQCLTRSTCVMVGLLYALLGFPVRVGAQEPARPTPWVLQVEIEDGKYQQAQASSVVGVFITSLSMRSVRVTAKTGLTREPAFRTLKNGRLAVGIVPERVPATTTRICVKTDPANESAWLVGGESQISARWEGQRHRIFCRISDLGPAYRDEWVFTTTAQSVSPGMWQGPDSTWFSPNATHLFLSRAKLLGFQFASDPAYPLTFKLVADEGYIHLCGRGRVVAPDGAVRSLGSDDTVKSWLPLLQSSDQLVREAAAQALGWLAASGDEDGAVPALIGALQDSASEVRRNAAEALGRIRDARARGALDSLLKAEKDSWVLDVAQDSASRLQ